MADCKACGTDEATSPEGLCYECQDAADGHPIQGEVEPQYLLDHDVSRFEGEGGLVC